MYAFNMLDTTLDLTGVSEERLVVEDVSKRKRIMESIHNSSHLGINRTLDLVSSKYYWPGLAKDVKQYVSLAMHICC